MSFREKIRLNFPLYFVLSLLFSISVWSLWFPNWIGTVDNTEAAPITSFSTAVEAVSKLPAAAQLKIAYNNGVYAMVFASTSVASGSPTTTCAYAQSGAGGLQACKLFFTSSTNGGVTWGTPIQVSNFLYFASNREAISDFSYDSRRSVWAVTYRENGNTNDLVQSTSTNGVSWSTNTVISDDSVGGGYIGRNAAMAFSTSSDLRAVLFQKGPYMAVGTTSNSGLTTSWPTSTVEVVDGYLDVNADNFELARPLGISIDVLNNIHAVYALATNTSRGYEIVYASSTNLGLTWTTSSISGISPVSVATMACFECGANATAIDPYTGRLSVMYHQSTGLIAGDPMTGSTTLKFGQLGVNGVWTTSTISTHIPFSYSLSSFLLVSLHPTGLSVPYTGMYAGAFFGTSSNPYLAVNTSTPIIENINTDTLHNMSEMSTVYNPTMKELAVAYVNSSDYKVKFTTTSLRVAQVNEFATTTAINPAFPSDGTGLVTVTTTVSDANRENITLYVDYSSDNGTTWSSSTLRTATGEGGSLTTSTGKITAITTTDGDQAISFTWDSLANLPATSTAVVKLRILADDGVSTAGYRLSSAFTVDNLAPGVPTFPILTPSTSTMAFSWTASTGTPSLYLVSSTAMSVSTTAATTVTSTDLLPNTLYTFQVKAQDSYSNTSSFSSVTSTYTDPIIPTSTTAVSGGSTSMTVTWNSYNGSGTVYELYNVTDAAVVVTTTATTYSVTGLTAATSYQFKVRAQYSASSTQYTSYSETSTAVSTDAAASSGSSGGGGGSATPPAPPIAPSAQPVTAATSVVVDLNLNEQKKLTIGASEHTLTLLSQDSQKVFMKIQSEPITVNLSVKTPVEVDTDKDTIADLRVTYMGLVQGKARVNIINLTDENELKNPFTIQAGAYETISRTVRLRLNSSNASQVALSNTPDFAGSTFKTYSSDIMWELSSGNGTKTVYARLRTSAGGMLTVTDTILLKESGTVTPPVVTLPVQIPPVVTPPAPVIPALKRTLKRNLSGADVKQLQVELQRQGFFPKTVIVNTTFGPTTESSVKAFEKAKGIKVDGIVDLATWNVLFGVQTTVTPNPSIPTLVPTTKPTLSRGSSGAQVFFVQEKLKVLGYFPKNVPANSFYGPTTQNAVRTFQKANGISQTGTVGPVTWGVLSR